MFHQLAPALRPVLNIWIRLNQHDSVAKFYKRLAQIWSHLKTLGHIGFGQSLGANISMFNFVRICWYIVPLCCPAKVRLVCWTNQLLDLAILSRFSSSIVKCKYSLKKVYCSKWSKIKLQLWESLVFLFICSSIHNTSFSSLLTNRPNKLVFVTGKPFQPSLM